MYFSESFNLPVQGMFTEEADVWRFTPVRDAAAGMT